MTERIIDLGWAEPWTPPETPRPRRRARPRTVVMLLALVAALTAVAPSADAPGRAPLLHFGVGVLNAATAGGQVFVTRYAGEGSHWLEAYDPGGGPPRWTIELGDGDQFAYADPDVAVLTSEYGDHAPALSIVHVRDARTGAELWQRAGAGVAGTGGGWIVLVDLRGLPAPNDGDGAGEQPVVRQENRMFAVDPRTGAAAWSLVVPAGSEASYGRLPASPYGLASLSTLDPDGTLRAYDLRTGALTRTDRLARAASVGGFELGEGDGFPAPGTRAGQVAVLGFDTPGEDVYDIASGRLLWHADLGQYARLFGCAPDRWCSSDESGLSAFDAVTGRRVWRVETQDQVLGGDESSLVLGSFDTDASASTKLLLVDARTGATRQRLDDWHAVPAPGGRVVVWYREEDRRETTVGLLDPATGRIAVFGEGDSWAGQPSCTIDGRLIACGTVGDLTVWRLPDFVPPGP